MHVVVLVVDRNAYVSYFIRCKECHQRLNLKNYYFSKGDHQHQIFVETGWPFLKNEKSNRIESPFEAGN